MDIILSKALDGFKLSNEASGLADKTINWYDSILRLFQYWVLNQQDSGEIWLKDITGVEIRTYLSELRNRNNCFENHPFRPIENRPLSPRTIRGYYASLSSFFNWAVAEGFIDTSPLKNINRPKTPKYIPDPFSRDEIEGLIRACENLPQHTSNRAKAMLLILIDSGIRLSELVELELPEINLKLGRAKIMGKGSKERYIYFGRKTKKALWRYISLSRPDSMPMVTNLFLSVDGLPMKNRRVSFILSYLGKKAGVDSVHAHRFRRTAAVQFIRNGGNIFALQKLLGHESLEMVRSYVKLASKDVENAFKNSSPVDRWNL